MRDRVESHLERGLIELAAVVSLGAADQLTLGEPPRCRCTHPICRHAGRHIFRPAARRQECNAFWYQVKWRTMCCSLSALIDDIIVSMDHIIALYDDRCIYMYIYRIIFIWNPAQIIRSDYTLIRMRCELCWVGLKVGTVGRTVCSIDLTSCLPPNIRPV